MTRPFTKFAFGIGIILLAVLLIGLGIYNALNPPFHGTSDSPPSVVMEATTVVPPLFLSFATSAAFNLEAYSHVQATDSAAAFWENRNGQCFGGVNTPGYTFATMLPGSESKCPNPKDPASMAQFFQEYWKALIQDKAYGLIVLVKTQPGFIILVTQAALKYGVNLEVPIEILSQLKP